MSDTPETADTNIENQKLSRDVINNRLSGTVTHPESGEKFSVTFKDPTDDELERLQELEEQAEEGDVDADRQFGNVIVNDFLLEPDLEASEIGMAWKQAITVGLLKALGADNKALQEAEEFFEGRLEGNGT